MSMSNRLVATASILALSAGVALAAESANLGRIATPEEIGSYDISSDPDGTGLPPGNGTAKQGEAVYVAKCQPCHGEKGQNGTADRLVGGQGTIADPTGTKRPIKTVGSFWPYATSVFAYIRRAMPFQESQSLSNDELYAVTAYLLQLNGIIKEDEIVNAQTLPKVQMPNRDGFFTAVKPN